MLRQPSKIESVIYEPVIKHPDDSSFGFIKPPSSEFLIGWVKGFLTSLISPKFKINNFHKPPNFESFSADLNKVEIFYFNVQKFHYILPESEFKILSTFLPWNSRERDILNLNCGYKPKEFLESMKAHIDGKPDMKWIVTLTHGSTDLTENVFAVVVGMPVYFSEDDLFISKIKSVLPVEVPSAEVFPCPCHQNHDL